jgi:hypothetical protein
VSGISFDEHAAIMREAEKGAPPNMTHWRLKDVPERAWVGLELKQTFEIQYGQIPEGEEWASLSPGGFQWVRLGGAA